MKHTKMIDVPASKREVVDSCTCDLCGVTIKSYGCAVDEVTLSHSRGTRYPEGGWGEDTEFDICGKCFTDKLLPWLQEQGAVPTATEWDY